VPKQVFADAGTELVALGSGFSEKLFVFGGALAGLLFFFFDFGRFFLHFRLSCFYFLVAGIGVDHQLKDLVFVRSDFLFGELDFMQESFVLLIGLYVEGLVAILGDLSPQVADVGFVLAAGGLVGFDGSLCFLELGFGTCESLLDDGHALGEFGNLILQAANFPVDILQFEQIFYVWKHPAALILACEWAGDLKRAGPS